VLNTGSEPAVRARLHSTSGGSIETELKELAVSPTRSPDAVRAVTMVTPVANMPRLDRNSRGENAGGVALRAGDITGWNLYEFS